MRSKVYLSNIAPHWPLGRQEAMFAEKVPGWPKVSTYCDVLLPSVRKAHNASSLVERASMVRPTSRRNGGGETVYVASLPCVAWGMNDLTGFLASLMERSATLVVLDVGLTIPPDAGARVLNKAVETFAATKRQRVVGGSIVGATISANKRRAATDDAIARIRDRWPLPSKDYPTKALLTEAGLTYNTARDRLKARPEAQKWHLAAQKRKAMRQRDVST